MVYATCWSFVIEEEVEVKYLRALRAERRLRAPELGPGRLEPGQWNV